jgi:DNA polymerase-3 subunit epsilon
MISLYFDVETNDYHIPAYNNPALPVQLAMVLGTEDRVFAAVAYLIRTDGWVDARNVQITQRVIDIHDINTQLANTLGEPAEIVLHQFRRLLGYADQVVGHNIRFDIEIIDHAFAIQRLPRINWPPFFCTMEQAAPIMQMPIQSQKYAIGGWKLPKLGEAYKFFSGGRDAPKAHDALVDIYTTRFVHRGILRHRREKADADNTPETASNDTGRERPALDPDRGQDRASGQPDTGATKTVGATARA